LSWRMSAIRDPLAAQRELICPTRLGKNSAFSGVDVRFAL
jgi:hypothetical protein